MAKIPLNKFRNRLVAVPTSRVLVYEAPINRATILINVQASNTTDGEIRVSLYMSNDNGGSYRSLVKDFPIPGQDARSLISGRVVLQGIDGTTEILNADQLYVEASDNGIDLSVSLLETVNKT
jgi:hypothetical protein